MNKYVRVCKAVNDYGSLVNLEEVENPSKIKNILNSHPDKDWYRSMFYYGPEAKDHFTKNNSIKGFSGTALSNKLVFDFDSELDLTLAYNDTRQLLSRLQKEKIAITKSVAIYFSGKKGFHIELATVRDFSPEDMKHYCSIIAEGLKTFDSQIYNTTRLFRIPNTKHQETGLYKIRLTPQEFASLTIEQIKDKAKNPVYLETPLIPVANVEFLNKTLVKPENKAVSVIVTEDEHGIRGLDTIDFSKCPKHIPRCIYALQQGIMKPGQRNHLFYRLTAFYKNLGMEKEVTHRVLKGIAELNNRLYPEHDKVSKDEIWATVNSHYSNKNFKQIPGASGTSEENELLKNYCLAIKSETRCILHSKTSVHSSIVKIDDVSDSFESFAKNFGDNIIKTGIHSIDKEAKITIGTTNLLVGATGTGKTSMILNILENSNKFDQPSIFFSLDTHKNLIYLKLAQKLTGLHQDDILDFYKKGNKSQVAQIRELITAHYKKTFFDFSNTLTIEDMQNKIQSVEEKSGQKIKLAVVDYASRVSGPYADTYANARYNALKSVEIANNTEAAWLYVHQISRNMGNGMTPLRTKRAAKEAGDYEESATIILNMWRPFMTKEDLDKYVKVFIAKNRLGREVEIPLHWDGEKGLVTDMTEEEREHYKIEIEPLELQILNPTIKTQK